MSNFKIHILASGSKGNATLIQAGATSFLIDAGISARKIKNGLAKIGLKASELDGIFITHEHTDHINGLPVFARQAGVPVFANEETWFASGCLSRIESRLRRMLPDSMFTVGEISLQTFSIPHDAAAPVGFNFFYKDQKCTLATDLGHADSKIKAALAGSDAIVLEANHDVKLLAQGRYPYYLKQRISGRHGHLSNKDAGELLCDIVGTKPTQIFLAHLSQENNCPSVARNTVADILAQKGLLPKTDIYVASQDELVSNCIKGE